MIRKIKFYCNNNDVSEEILQKAKEIFTQNGFEVNESDYELAIAIGGDGSFLRMLRENNFDSNIIFVGINTGTLGFLQEINPGDIEKFTQRLLKDEFTIDKLDIQQTEVYMENNMQKFYTLNEIVVRENTLNTCTLEINIDTSKLETYVGDGVIICTSVGSTAYNLSSGGSIVNSSLSTLQITHIGPLNSKAYKNLANSIIIPSNKVITIVPAQNRNNLIISFDGKNYLFPKVTKIKNFIDNKYINIIRLDNYDFTNIVNEKIIQ